MITFLRLIQPGNSDDTTTYSYTFPLDFLRNFFQLISEIFSYNWNCKRKESVYLVSFCQRSRFKDQIFETEIMKVACQELATSP